MKGMREMRGMRETKRRKDMGTRGRGEIINNKCPMPHALALSEVERMAYA
jgi:hypothetical protein